MKVHRSHVAVVVGLVGLALALVAHAGMSKKVQNKFKGRILISDEELPDGDSSDDAGTIRKFEKLHKTSVQSDKVDDVASWTFFYTAFLKTQPGSGGLTMDFHKTDKAKTYVANSRLEVDSSLTIISGRLTIDENEGPNPGTAYDVIIRGKKGGKEIELARTRLTLK